MTAVAKDSNGFLFFFYEDPTARVRQKGNQIIGRVRMATRKGDKGERE